MNFFESTCQEPPLNEKVFGLCDDEDGTKAYTNIDQPDKWIGTVKNDRAIGVTFTAIDKCILKDGELLGQQRCDGMLTSDEHLYFVELKNQAKKWQSDAIAQLEATIKLFLAHNDGTAYRYKKAYACNKGRSKFQVIESELNKRFFDTYRFRIDAQAEIIIL